MMRATRPAQSGPSRLVSLVLCYLLVLPVLFPRQAVLAAPAAKATSAKAAAALPAPAAAAPQGGQTPYGGTPIALPGTVYAKDFDNGGAGVAYHDTSAGNTGGEYRNTDVDICDNGGSSGVAVGWTKPGEWLEYTINVSAAGTYRFIVQVSSDGAGGTFHIEFNGVNKTGTLTVPDTGGWENAQSVIKDGVSLSAGQQVMRIAFDGAGSHGDVGDITSVRVVNPSTPQTPYKGSPLPVPGVIEMEDFDNGGETISYSDLSAGNSGGLYRPAEHVDIYEGYGTGHYVWARAGEWLEYTVNVAASGSHAFIAQVAAGDGGGGFHVEIDGVNVTGAMAVPNTEWNMRSVAKTGVQLTAGQHVMRVVMDSNGPSGGVGDFGSIRVASEQTQQTPYHGTPAGVPGTIQAEDFDKGGELIAYFDHTAGNSGGKYRPAEHVEIYEGYGTGAYIWPKAGEWLEYTVNVSKTSTYSFVGQWSAGDGPGGTYHIEVDGVNVTGPISVPDTGWSWQGVTKSGVQLTAGQHVVRIVMDGNGTYDGVGDFDSFRIFDQQGAQTPFGTKLVPAGAEWSYLDDGSDQGTDWRGITFDNSGWPTGRAQLGYGDGDEETAVGYGGDANNKHVTTYFRRSFHVGDPALHTGLKLRLLRDDGAVVYLNGVEVYRSNMPEGEVTSGTLAVSDGTSESDFWEAALNPALLRGGTNVVAVEVHQAYSSSSDISFDLELIATPIAVPGIVQAENFDNGGEGVSYSDSTAGNLSGGKYRATDVDVFDGYGTGNFHVGHTRVGEWLEYTINVAASGTYSFVGQWSAGDGPGGTYHIEIDGVNVTGTISVPDTDWHRRSVTKTGVQLTAGQHVMRVVMDSNGAYGGVGDFHAVRIVDEQATQTPFHGVPAPLPGTIQAEDFDRGGEGKAYADTTAGNDGHRYRLGEDVDIGEGYGTGYYVSPTATEWLEYTVNVTKTSTYSFVAQWTTGDGAGGTYHIEVDGVNVSGPLSVPNTDWEWGSVTKTGVQLTAGQHVVRLVMDSNGIYNIVGDLDSLRVVDEQAAHTPFRGTPVNLPGTVQMEDFDDGGEGKAYHDLTTGNHSGWYRDTDVDVENDAGAFAVGYTQPGEWLKYTVNVSAAGAYNLGVRLWADGTGGKFHVEVDGTDVTGPMSVPNAGWGNWQTVTKTGVNLTAGRHVIRFVMDAAETGSAHGADFDSFTFSSTATPSNGKIVFASNRNGNNEIYSMNADGTSPLRLTNNTSSDVDPTSSPDGMKIAFTSNRNGNNEIYSMNADGTAQARLTNNTTSDNDPAWSPDGTRIAFVSNRDGNNEIYVMYADGYGQTRLTENSSSDTEPAWSPDGSKIVFRSERNGNNEIYSMNADGSGQTRLTNNTTSDIEPFWSPDGSKIAFTSSRDGNNEIYVMNADGTGQTRVTNHAGNDDDASWSPDGAKLTFTSARDGNNEIYSMNVNGTDQIRLTTNTVNDHEPFWQGAASSGPAPTPTPEVPPQPTPTPLPVPAPDATIVADVVAFDQVFFYNRLGALNPAGMIYALRRDVVPIDSSKGLVPGNVQLRPGKRARPLVLRMNVGQKLQINFQNLLDPERANDNQPATRTASVHVVGLQLVNGITDDGSNVGQNPSSLVPPGGTATYTYFAEREGNHLFYSTAATTGGEGDGGSLAMGLFGMVNVEPKGAEWYRSQLTHAELEYATTGRTPAGQPIINYDALYPVGHPRGGQPVLRMLHGNEIIHSDLNAIITGPNKGRFPEGTYRSNPAEPDRNQPFREFSSIYHDEIKAVQAFPEFEDAVLSHTLHSVRDAFAINYGTGGIGAEILANRKGVGPMWNCTDCLYEEFFLSSWTVGDPAQIVDVPANTTDGNNNLIVGPKATKVLFPDDPSNVHHAYLNDHTKFRVVHAGPKEHHIHHLHAHQWFHTPDSDNSTTLDSQAFGPGYAFTTEILHGGAGNRAKTTGDSIYHCHFYPHFAMGMWAHWRVHDVFEEGTPLDGDGRPLPGSRALPDGEISAGTPIPGVVPIPTLPMPPVPQAQVSIVNGQAQVSGAGNPGFPFFVPAQAGHRPPHPPLDTIDDGGLPRHIITGGEAVHHKEHLPQFDLGKARLDFDKSLVRADARAIPEAGTPTEKAAMNFHAQRTHPSFTPTGAPANFVTNGLPPVSGAPFADPCRDDAGNPAGKPRLYKSANIQLDVTFNKAGWHFPQQRISALWDDVAAFRNGSKPPEPLFFRANTNDCVSFQFTNLVPRVYELDDYQVRTPTDIMGQHIHLVKFDVLASDGAGNGFNYEDGSFAPEEVIERIHAINAFGGLRNFNGNARSTLTPKAHPFFGTLGAQTTVSRWFADDVRNRAGEDRTLRTAFTHDHFGPSTHQQVGLYAGLVIEPIDSTWRHSETGQIFGTRFDGGPTSWRADILTPRPEDTYREFLIEFADFQHAYKAGGGVDGMGRPVPDPANVINPPAKKEVGLPFLLERPDQCPGGAPLPCPEAISADDVGTMVVNYRNEPLPLRLADNPNSSTPMQAPGLPGDLSHVYRSDITRAFAPMNSQPNFYPPLTGGLFGRDPFTPLLRAYEDDRVQIRVLVGAHEEGHNFGVHGIKWLFEPADPNSGYRNNQMMGISEHFEFIIPTLPKSSIGSFADYLYQPGVAVDDQWNGLWGIMRAYNRTVPDLQPLPNNPDGHGPVISNVGDFNGVCPKTAPARNFNVSAVLARDALPGGTLVYNPRPNQGGQLHDPTAIIYVRSSDLDANNQLLPGVPVEPLILRAKAGECINLTLANKLPASPPDLDGFNTMPMIVDRFNANQVKPSGHVGLHPQLVFFDVTRSDGTNVGFNKVQTAAPGQSTTYQWYAGDMTVRADGLGISAPIEFGATNLMPADPIKHSNKGAIGALIIEPLNATWTEDAHSRASATVTHGAVSFREFVLLHQTDINLRFGERFDAAGNHAAVPNLAEAEDPEDSGQKAFNYRAEPFWKRMGFEPNTPLEQTRDFNFTNVLSNSQVGGDPVTPVFTAAAGVPVRFRLLMPGGHARNSVFNLHGHIWEELPYINNSRALGHNPLSQWEGARFGIGAGSHFDLLLKNGAGGRFQIRGDYLYRNQSSFMFDAGMWGVFRVQ